MSTNTFEISFKFLFCLLQDTDCGVLCENQLERLGGVQVFPGLVQDLLLADQQQPPSPRDIHPPQMHRPPNRDRQLQQSPKKKHVGIRQAQVSTKRRRRRQQQPRHEETQLTRPQGCCKTGTSLSSVIEIETHYYCVPSNFRIGRVYCALGWVNLDN